jgi:hypothetical protein
MAGLTEIKKVIPFSSGLLYYYEACISDKTIKMKNKLEVGAIVEKIR